MNFAKHVPQVNTSILPVLRHVWIAQTDITKVVPRVLPALPAHPDFTKRQDAPVAMTALPAHRDFAKVKMLILPVPITSVLRVFIGH